MEWKKVELRDEHGEGFHFYRYEDLSFPEPFMRQENVEGKLQQIKNLQYEDGSVLLCSYPKTGSHWIANIVHFLLSDQPVDEMLTFSPTLVEFSPRTSDVEKTSGILNSHLRPNRLPDSYFQNGGKVLMQVRNPKDSMVSLYYHMQRGSFSQMKMTWNKFFDCYINGDVPFGSCFDYYDSFEKKIRECPNANVCVVHFENLKKDGLNELKRIQKFLGKSHSEERLQAILDRLTVKNLREEVNSGKVKSTLVDASGKSVLYRKGEIGDWRTHFTVAQNEMFDRVIEERFKNSMFYIESP